ncbi:MAG: extracellular solute-binding protein [Caldilineaceae bacterium]|nr:extracellular solute-binding protein [Caldilineaceae bacterium]MBP8108534.1 extracellular solute-binding protein [Caldilineaceae bacterium]MBP8123530.1 extracellular solute-binding protein [Caldilineaceae bacterium]MBP9074813.1 extracellular solute-binding protein [Caldilineaceae bacterium]
MRTTSRKLSLLFLTLLLALAMTACGGDDPAPTPTPPPTATLAPDQPTPTLEPTVIPSPTPTPGPEGMTGKLVIWHSWSQADGDALAQMLTAAQAAYPTLQIDTLFVAIDNVPQAYADAVLAGGGPDLLLAPDWWTPDLISAGVLAPLDNYVTQTDRESYWPATLNSLTENGSLYGLPTNYELVSLYVNKSLLADTPLPATTDDLLTLAAQNPALGIGLYANLFHLSWGIPAYGGALFDADNRAILDQTPGTADYLGWLQQAAATPGIFVEQDYGALIDRFKKGEFAFFVDGPWSAAELRQALGDSLTVAPLPAGPAGPAQPWLGVDAIFVNPTVSQAQQWQAVTLARFLTDAQNGGILAQVAGRLPANRNAIIGDDPVRQGFVAQAATAQPLPLAPEMQAVWGYGGDMLLKVVTGGADPTQVVAETTTLINEANGK